MEDELRALLQKEIRLTEAFTDGDVSPNVYKQKTQELDRRLAFERELGALPLDPAELGARVSHIVDVAASLQDVQDVLSEDRKGTLVAEVFKTVVLSRAGTVGFTLTSPFERLASAAAKHPPPWETHNAEDLVDQILDAA